MLCRSVICVGGVWLGYVEESVSIKGNGCRSEGRDRCRMKKSEEGWYEGKEEVVRRREERMGVI